MLKIGGATIDGQGPSRPSFSHEYYHLLQCCEQRKKAHKVHVLQGNELLSLRDRMSKENLSFAHEKSEASSVP